MSVFISHLQSLVPDGRTTELKTSARNNMELADIVRTTGSERFEARILTCVPPGSNRLRMCS